MSDSITKSATAQLREVARYLDAHAEELIGDMDSVYVIEGGLRFTFELGNHETIPTVEVSKEFIVYERDHG